MLTPEFSSKNADERNRFLREVLATAELEITFTKVNGETRVMPCTLKSEALPTRELKEHHKTRLYNPEVISVWCTDKSEWRSLKVMNITDLRILP